MVEAGAVLALDATGAGKGGAQDIGRLHERGLNILVAAVSRANDEIARVRGIDVHPGCHAVGPELVF